MATPPLVSIGLPVYNGQRFLSDAIDALLAQDCPSLEIVICDNASDDTTEQIARRASSADSRIQYFRSSSNHGAARNFNWAFQMATGRYFKWAAHDDLHDPRFVSLCVEALEADPELTVAYSRAVDIDEEGRLLHEWGPMPICTGNRPSGRLADVLSVNHRAFPIFGVFPRAVLARTSLIKSFALSDLLTLGELALLGPWHEVPENLFLHREHDGRSTRTHVGKDARATWFDTARPERPAVPHWNLLAGYLRAMSRVRMGGSERARTLGVVMQWARQNKRVLGHEAKVAGRRSLKGRRQHRDPSPA